MRYTMTMTNSMPIKTHHAYLPSFPLIYVTKYAPDR